MHRQRFMIAFVAVIAGLLMAACGGSDGAEDTAAPTPAPTVAPAAAAPTAAPEAMKVPDPVKGLEWDQPMREGVKYGGSLVTSYGSPGYEPAHLDVQQLLQAALIVSAGGSSYSRLLAYEVGPDINSFESRVTADLAESWEQEDDVTYIFHLREGTKWHNIAPVNGRDLTCDDILYSYRRQLTPGFSNSSIIASVDIDKSSCLDKYTLKLVATGPDAGFLNNLADGHSKIVAREAVELNGDLKNGPTIGTGPFVHTEYSKNIRTVKVRNPAYYDPGLPFVDKLTFLQFGDTAAMNAALRTHQMDILGIRTPVELEQLQKTNPDLKYVKSFSSLRPWQVGLNNTFEPFKEKKVRQAVSKCIDRKAIIAGPLGGAGNLYTAGIPIPDMAWNLPDKEYEEWYERDVELGKKLLADAGYANGFDVEFTNANYGELSLSLGEAIVEMLKECGIRPTMKTIDAATYTTTILAQGDMEMYWGPAGGSDDPASEMYQRFGCDQSRNAVHRCDPVWDALALQVRVTFDPLERKALVQQGMRYMLDSSDYLAIYSSFSQQVHQPWVGNSMTGAGSYNTYRYNYFWLDTDHPNFPSDRK